MPTIDEGVDMLTTGGAPTPAPARYLPQSMPGARFASSAALTTLFFFTSSRSSVADQVIFAIFVSSACMFRARSSALSKPAILSRRVMWARCASRMGA